MPLQGDGSLLSTSLIVGKTCSLALAMDGPKGQQLFVVVLFLCKFGNIYVRIFMLLSRVFPRASSRGFAVGFGGPVPRQVRSRTSRSAWIRVPRLGLGGCFLPIL